MTYSLKVLSLILQKNDMLHSTNVTFLLGLLHFETIPIVGRETTAKPSASSRASAFGIATRIAFSTLFMTQKNLAWAYRAQTRSTTSNVKMYVTKNRYYLSRRS